MRDILRDSEGHFGGILTFRGTMRDILRDSEGHFDILRDNEGQ